jgi:methyl-CpG-binding domain protein 4
VSLCTKLEDKAKKKDVLFLLYRVKMPPTLRKRITKKPTTPTALLRTANPSQLPEPEGLTFRLRPVKFGLIQERICCSLYALVVQAILWNQTRGKMARPVLFALLAKYPTPEELSSASLKELTSMLQPIGLHNLRAVRLIALANAWLAAPPCKERRYRRLHYPSRGSGTDVKPGEVLGIEDEREGWEIAHLPGMGAYAIDSYRIFYRDKLREVDMTKDVEPEWKRVTADDKDLKAYLKWKWEIDQGLNQVKSPL